MTTTAMALGTSQDTTDVAVRALTQEQVEEILAGDEYIYGREELLERDRPEGGMSAWEKFLEWLDDLFNSSNDATAGAPVRTSPGWAALMQLLFILAIAGVIGFAIYKSRHLFTSGGKKGTEDSDYLVFDEDINKINFQQMIEEAVSSKDFRKAIRLHFLMVLKNLSDAQLIRWKIDKTNFDYYFELSGHPLQSKFMDVTTMYEYVWYGEFDLNLEQYRNTEQKFQQFGSTLTNAKGQ